MKSVLLTLAIAATLQVGSMGTRGTANAQQGSRSGYSIGGYHRPHYHYHYGANYGGYLVPGRSYNRGYDYGGPANLNRGYGYGYSGTYYSPGVRMGAGRRVGVTARGY